MLTTIPAAPATQRPTLEALAQAVRELQQQRTAIVAGGAARARLAVTGIAVGDVIREAIFHRVTGGNIVAVSDLAAEATISAGVVAFTTTDTTGGFVAIRYVDTTF